MSENLDEKVKNKDFGFKCLHYSVSEASKTLLIHIINKSGHATSVKVKTVDEEAKGGKDYEQLDETV